MSAAGLVLFGPGQELWLPGCCGNAEPRTVPGAIVLSHPRLGQRQSWPGAASLAERTGFNSDCGSGL